MTRRWPERAYLHGLLHGVFGLFLVPALLALWAWCLGAIYFSNLPSETLRSAAAALFALGSLGAFALLPNRRRTLVWFLVVCAAILIWWWSIAPSHDRVWRPEVAVLPYAKIEGDRMTVHNVRNFDYRSPEDFTVRYYQRTYDLKDLESVDLIVSHWDDLIAVAHTLLSFGFRGGDHLVVSVETRLEQGEPQSGLRGLFKQYELIYVLADEADVVRLRTNFRKEDVFLYPTRSPPEEARSLLLDIVARVNRIAAEPEFYNTIDQNCSTALVPHIERVRRTRLFDVRLLVNGFTDKLAYERGWLATDLSFAGTKARHYVNQYVRDDADPAGFSRRIRPYLQDARAP